MLNRRTALKLALSALISSVRLASVDGAAITRVLFVHGRDQQGKNVRDLTTEWLDALKRGAKGINRSVPLNLDIAFPFYGDVLDGFVRSMDIPLTSDVQTRGAAPDEDFLSFQADIAEAMRVKAGVTEAQVASEYGANPKQKGPLNWEWVHAILRAVDKHSSGLNARAIETFTRDVYLYTRRAGVRSEIDKIVAASLTTEPTVVVAHSLGSIVAYNILRSDPRELKVPLFVTVGSPLGVRAIRDQLRPLRYPPVDMWYNAFDLRDVVALFPLDGANFPVSPSIANSNTVRNGTSNRHGIAGYLDDRGVAGQILDVLS